ncbi:MAG: GTP-binding protein [Pirellulaceae bacterium]|nr:GTP-binding protein [Pirellulaceae bacterium]
MSLPKNPDPNKTNLPIDAQRSSDDGRDTVATLLTGTGRSAIAVIGVAGDRASWAVNQCFHAATARRLSPGQIRYGAWGGVEKRNASDLPGETAAESVVLLPISESELEVHCHGGTAATSRILNDLRQLGIDVVAAHDDAWRRDQPLAIREAEQVLSHCLTARTAAAALDQVRGALAQWCEAVLSGSMSPENVTLGARDILSRADWGLHLGDRFDVVMAGPPNVGKSSLINAIVGYDRSITMDVAGTTRDVLHAETVIDGIPVRLSDTAGIRASQDAIEREGVLRAREATQRADLVIWVQEPATDDVIADSELFAGRCKKSIRVMNKADLISPGRNTHSSQPGVLATVATTGQGVAMLMAAICDALVGDRAEPGSALPLTQRQRGCLSDIASATDESTRRQRVAELLWGNHSPEIRE